MADTTRSTHTLGDLVAVLGEATEEQIRAHFYGVPDSTPVGWGREVATPRIVTDAPHIIGDAYVAYQACNEPQRQWLAAISTETLRLAAGAVMLAQGLYEQRRHAGKSSRTELGEATGISDQVKASEIGRRNVLYGALTKIAAGVEPYASRIAGAYSKSEAPAQLADSLDALITIGREMLKDRDPGIMARRRTTQLNTGWLDQAATRAAEVRKVGEKAAVVRTAPSISAAEVDLRDGWALMLLDEIVTAFDHAHDADPTIPRINVYSLRNALRPPAGKKSPTVDGPARNGDA